MGGRVRWDGNHEREDFVAEALAPFAELVPSRPEVELGLGVPREPIRLEGSAGESRLVATGSGRDARRDPHARTLDDREGRVPVILVRHPALRLGVDYLMDQVYFDPHPAELTLRPWL